MTNLTSLRSSDASTKQIARAQFVHGVLTDNRWSISAAALRIGMAKSTLASRLNGSTQFMAEDIEDIAKLLKRDPVEFYAEYLKAPTEDYGYPVSPVIPFPTRNAPATAARATLAPVTQIGASA